jgi:Uma2 family endonuclease
MNVQLPAHMNKSAFLAWVQGREGRYELVEGRVIMMVGASRAHGLIVRNLIVLLDRQLDSTRWAVIPDFGLDAGPETLRYPDIMVDRLGAGTDYTTTSPALLAEVLSPSTESLDLRDKAAEYLKLPSLGAYLVFAQSKIKAWVWVRERDAFPSNPEVITGRNALIRVASMRLELPLSEIYKGVPPG